MLTLHSSQMAKNARDIFSLEVGQHVHVWDVKSRYVFSGSIDGISAHGQRISIDNDIGGVEYIYYPSEDEVNWVASGEKKGQRFHFVFNDKSYKEMVTSGMFYTLQEIGYKLPEGSLGYSPNSSPERCSLYEHPSENLPLPAEDDVDMMAK